MVETIGVYWLRRLRLRAEKCTIVIRLPFPSRAASKSTFRVATPSESKKDSLETAKTAKSGNTMKLTSDSDSPFPPLALV